MRTFLVASFLAGICLLLRPAPASAAERIPWKSSLSVAMQQARRTNRLVMLDFYTDWCAFCKKLDRETYTHPRVVQLAKQVVPVRMNAEKEGRTSAMKYGVTGFPTILFLTPQGNVAGRIGGYLPAGPFAAVLQQQIDHFRAMPVLEARLRANPGDAEAAARLVVIYANQGRKAEARTLLDRAAKGNGRSGLLARAYNAVADTYQEEGQLDRAIALFQKAVQTARHPADIAYAHVSMGACYLARGQFQQAIPPLEAALATPGAPQELQSAAQQMLTLARQRAR